MNKRGIHWQEIATIMLMLVVIFAVIIAFNRESRAEFGKIIGIRQQIESYKLPDLGIATPDDLAKAERTPEGRQQILQRMIESADSYFGRKEYSSATKAYQEIVNRCDGDLKADCSLDIKNNAQMRLEESIFREISLIKDNAAKLKAYQDYILKNPQTRFIAEAYFEIGRVYTNDVGLYNKEEAIKYYKLAREKVSQGYTGVSLLEIDSIIQALSKISSGNLIAQQSLSTFTDNWILAKEFFDKREYQQAHDKMVEASFSFERSYVGLDADTKNKFRLDQIKFYKPVNFARAAAIYEKLKTETTEKTVSAQAKNLIGVDYLGKISLTPQDAIQRIYQNTGLILKSHDGSTAKVCVTYQNRELSELGCITLSRTEEYLIVPGYPFIAIKANSIGESNTKKTELEFKVISFEGLSNTVTLTEGGSSSQIFSEIPYWVSYDGNELGFLDAKNGWTHFCDIDWDIDWEYISATPLNTPYVCLYMPSVKVWHMNYQDNPERVTVKFTYTP